MNLKIPCISIREMAAVGTWAVIFAINLYWLVDAPEQIKANSGSIILLFLLYIGCFFAVVRDGVFPKKSYTRYGVFLVQLICAYALMALLPTNFLSILSIIWVSMLPFFTSLRRSLFIMLLVVVSWYGLYAVIWPAESVVFSGLLYGTFHLFAIVANYQTLLAQTAAVELQKVNGELKAAQNLLAEASKQNERTRIARDLHDLLGHHLTALIINLQVAGHISEGEAKDKIEQCHGLAKLLLSDVREAVSTLRENKQLDFGKMIELMVERTPNIKINTHIDTQLDLDDLPLAKTLLSLIQEALTNSLRHSGASEFSITLENRPQSIRLELVDNGKIENGYILGNGMQGMQERVAELNGRLIFGRLNDALKIEVLFPNKEQNQPKVLDASTSKLEEQG